MASSSDSSYHASGSGLNRRPAASSANRPVAGGPIRPDVEPAPRPRPALQKLAVAAIVVLGGLQLFLSPTHFRDPSDRHRNWIPFDPNRSAPISSQRSSQNQETGVPGIHIFSWTDCLDLPVLSVLANSTLSGARYPEQVNFHFFIPEEEDKDLSYYKLKVVLPKSNFEIIKQKDIKHKINFADPEGESVQKFLNEAAPLIVPKLHLSLSKYLYISSDSMIKGKIEDLFGIDLGPYAIGAAEDCSNRLGDYVKIEVLNAIQRAAPKGWVSDKPYDKNACLPDFNVLLVNPRKLDNSLLEAIAWWIKVLDAESMRGDHIRLAMALTIHEKYTKLPSTWKLVSDSTTKSDGNEESFVIPFDGPRRDCSKNGINQDQVSGHGDIWKQYLPSKSLAILAH